jgi:hypothetical protein
MATLAPFIIDTSFNSYYKGRLGLTNDLKRVEFYRNALKNQPGVSKQTITNFNKILKFNWIDYFDTSFSE